MGYLYSLSGFQPNGQAHEVADNRVDVLLDYEPNWIDVVRFRSKTVCAKSVPGRQNSAKFGNAPQEEGWSQSIDSDGA